MSLTLDILGRRAGHPVEPGELIEIEVDLVLANDITGPLAIKEFARLGAGRVFDPERIVLVNDHFTPNKDIASAEQAAVTRDFARAQGANFYDVGRVGVEHALLPEEGFIRPGQVVVGADSHTCTYGALGAFATGVGSTDAAVAMATGRLWFRVPETVEAWFEGTPGRWVGGKDLVLFALSQLGVDGALYASLEFGGPAVERLPVDGRLTMCNMAVELGAKNGIIAPDRVTADYLARVPSRPAVEPRVPGEGIVPGRGRGQGEAVPSCGDGAGSARRTCGRTYTFDAARIPPMVARPHSPANGAPAAELGDVPIDQVVIGSCTNGRLDDLRVAARILGGRKVHPSVRCLVIPGTPAIYRRALAEGIIAALLDAGAAVSTPTCGPCLGGHMGVLAAGERCVSTTNRNFVGRMGHRTSEVYLAGPAVAAASAVAGRIAAPEEVAS